MAFLWFLQDGGRPPSWICDACVGTAHKGHLVVFITVQNFVGIDVAVLIKCMFFDFASLAYSCPKIGGFGRFWPPKWEPYKQNPKTHILAQVRVVWAIMRENSSMCLTCRWVPQKGGINKSNFGYISPMCPEAPPVDGCTPNMTQP